MGRRVLEGCAGKCLRQHACRYLKVVWTWRFGTRYGDGVGSVGFAVGLDDLKDLFQPK